MYRKQSVFVVVNLILTLLLSNLAKAQSEQESVFTPQGYIKNFSPYGDTFNRYGYIKKFEPYSKKTAMQYSDTECNIIAKVYNDEYDKKFDGKKDLTKETYKISRPSILKTFKDLIKNLQEDTPRTLFKAYADKKLDSEIFFENIAPILQKTWRKFMETSALSNNETFSKNKFHYLLRLKQPEKSYFTSCSQNYCLELKITDLIGIIIDKDLSDFKIEKKLDGLIKIHERDQIHFTPDKINYISEKLGASCKKYIENGSVKISDSMMSKEDNHNIPKRNKKFTIKNK